MFSYFLKEVFMVETIITLTTIIASLLVVKGSHNFGKMRDSENQIFKTELERRHNLKSELDYVPTKYVSNM